MSETKSFSVEGSLSATSFSSSCEDICWATDEILIATLRNRKIQAFDVRMGTEIWSEEFSDDVRAIACGNSHVFVALWSGSILRFDSDSGEDSTPPDIPQPFLPDALAWIEEMDSLCILVNEGIWIYSGDLQTVTMKIPYEGYPFFSSAGAFALLAERNNSCTLADLTAGTTKSVYGPPHAGGRSTVPMDAPFLSNAFADGNGKLIVVVDNSWSTGTVSFHRDATSKPVTVDSKNGHAIAAVHWPTQRFAVSGTEENLILFDTSGERLEKINNAVTERTYAMAFSPSGNQIATLGSNGSVKVFGITP